MDRSGEREGHRCRSCSRVHPLRPAILVALLAAALTVGAAGRDISSAGAGAAPDSFTVKLIADGATRDLQTSAVSVAEFLAKAQVELGTHDRVTPALDRVLTPGAAVQVQRVTCRQVTVDEEIPAPCRRRIDHRVSGELVLEAGTPGLRRITYEVWEVDGRETARSALSQVVIRRPRPGLAVCGGRSSLPSRGGMPMIMESTGYDPGPRSCGRYASGRTAIGLRAGKGVAAVDPRVIPLGTRLYVEGYGPAVAGDVGGAIKGRRIDLCFDTYRQALQWGRRRVRVFVLE